MDLSNKSLALLLLAAVVISLGGTMITLTRLDQFQGLQGPGVTGMQTASGVTNLSIEGAVGCEVDTQVDFGSGPAPSGSDQSLATDIANTNFNDCTDGAGTNNCKGMELNNTGNVNINVTFNSTANGTTFLSDPAAVESDFRYFMRNGTYAGLEEGCVNTSGASWGGTWTDIPLTQTLICNNLTYTDSNDMMTMEFNVTVSPSEPTGEKRATITFLCGQV